MLARFILCFLILLLAAAAATSDPPIRERVFLSRTCTGSHWYTVESDDQSITVECYPSE
jgi:hypothetical protein